jgi:ATP-dependent helicase/nuclease subunit B
LIPAQISILLTPDSSAGRRVRRVAAERGLGLGVKVVTWPELLDEARSAYLLPPVSEDWNETVRHTIEQMEGGFWWRSFEVDPAGSASAIASSLEELIRSGGTEGAWSHPSLSDRTNAILSDLRGLWNRMDNVLPPELTLINDIRLAPDRAISQFSVHRIDDWPRLDRFQTQLANLLNERGETPSEDLLSILRETASLPDILEETPPPQKLASLCFSGRKGVLFHDDDIAFLVARDPLQEIECAAGIIQSLVGRGIAPRDIGVLVPNDPYYQRSMADVLSVTGIPTAGLPSQMPLRDLGGEVVRSLILLARGPVPKMALASLLASPIAPWPSDIGPQLSSNVMAGRFDLRAPHGMSEADERSLSLIRRLRDGKASIVDAIEVFAQDAADPVHVSRLRSLAKLIAEQTRDGQADHDRLLELVDHVTASVDQPTKFPLNGVRIFQENQEPWIAVKHLLVLGFNRGRYPSLPGAAPVLHDLEKQSINEHLGWDLPTSDTIMATRGERFQRQIATATETVKFLASARTIDGSPIQPAETATFLAGLLGQEPDDLFVPVVNAGVKPVQ